MLKTAKCGVCSALSSGHALTVLLCHCERLPRRLLATLGVSARNDAPFRHCEPFASCHSDPSKKGKNLMALRTGSAKQSMTSLRVKGMSYG